MKEYLSFREYILFQKYFSTFGIGQEAEYVRSGNLILTIANYITGAMGGKVQNSTVADIYPQLSYSNKKKRHSNQAVDWDNTQEHIKVQLIAAGLYTDEGDPKGYNPHSK